MTFWSSAGVTWQLKMHKTELEEGAYKVVLSLALFLNKQHILRTTLQNQHL